MFKILKQPLPFEPHFRKKLRVILFSGLFVFLFLYLFKPFGLSELDNLSLLTETIKYGLLTSSVLAVINFVFPKVFISYFKEETWTVLKDITFGMFNIVLIGIANFIYVSYKYQYDLNFKNAVYFVGITFLVGIFPVTFLILLKQVTLNRKYKTEALELSKQLNNNSNASLSEAEKLNSTDTLIQIVAENGKDKFTFSSDSILFIAAAGNYVEIFQFLSGKINKTLIRCSMKIIQGQLNGNNHFIRCHRAYIVNMKNISTATGNSQGLRLHFVGYLDSIPVSRNLDKEIVGRFAEMQPKSA